MSVRTTRAKSASASATRTLIGHAAPDVASLITSNRVAFGIPQSIGPRSKLGFAFLEKHGHFPLSDEWVGSGEMSTTNRGVRDIDVRIGHQLRVARQSQNMSQTALAHALGITFQQVQKYESGSNRISAGRLFDAAHVLGLPITYFFDGLKPSVRSRKR
jgi:DNA-binding XRE family transcriptional regulator